jgi:hypothetical protein
VVPRRYYFVLRPRIGMKDIFYIQYKSLVWSNL